MTLRIRIDRTRCIGAETCIQLAPTAFKWRDQELGKADLLDPTSVEDELIREAAAACPTIAIIVTEDDDGATA